MSTTKNEKRTRKQRTPEQMVADLEAEIARIKARAAARQAKAAPEGKPFVAAVKAIDRAIEAAREADNGEMLRALESARALLGEHLAHMGVGGTVTPKGTVPARKSTARRVAQSSGQRVRRSAEELEQLAQRIRDQVEVQPGYGIEAISKALGTSSAELKRPVQILLADGMLRTEGQKRGTTYFPSRRGGGARNKKERKTAKAR